MTERHTAIVTAAGPSTRMGVHKALLPWREAPLVAHQVRALNAAHFEPVVVTGADGDEVAAATPSCAKLAHNGDWRTGRSRSIEVGASALPGDPAAVLVVAVDQPIEPSVLDALAEHAGDPVVQPVDSSGRPGHPVIVGGDHVDALRDLRDEPEGLRSLVRRLRPRGTLVPIADLPHWDLNDPAAYRRARRASRAPTPLED